MPRFKAIALDMMGVVYPIGDDLRGLIIPFLQQEGCPATPDELIEAYRLCYKTNVPISEFWQRTGLQPPWDDVETRMLQSYTVTPGAREFLEASRAHALPVYSLTNDTAHWAQRRRQLHGIDEYFSGAVVSGALGVPKPQPAIYEELLKLLPCAPGECVFVDDRQENVDAAAKHGLSTVLFAAGGSGAHVAIKDFPSLAAYVGLDD